MRACAPARGVRLLRPRHRRLLRPARCARSLRGKEVVAAGRTRRAPAGSRRSSRELLATHYDPIYLQSMRRNFAGIGGARSRASLGRQRRRPAGGRRRRRRPPRASERLKRPSSSLTPLQVTTAFNPSLSLSSTTYASPSAPSPRLHVPLASASSPLFPHSSATVSEFAVKLPIATRYSLSAAALGRRRAFTPLRSAR